MNHQPFENLLFTDEPLSEDEKHALQDHLAMCNQCNDLEDAWMNVFDLFAEIPDVGPAPGFLNRWQTTLETDRAAAKVSRQRWQSWIVLVLMGNGAALALLLMGLQIFRTYGSFTDLILSWVCGAATFVMIGNGFQNVLWTLFRTIPGLIPTTWWVGIAITLSVSTLLWIVSMAKLTSFQRRVS